MKKYLLALLFTISAIICLIPYPSKADNYSLTEMQIASVLYNEAGGAGRQSMMYVADVIRNRYVEQRTKYAKYSAGLTYADILFQGAFEGAAPKFANKTAAQLDQMGRNWSKNSGKWEQALKIARDTVSGALPKVAQGANSFNRSHSKSKSIFVDPATDHRFYSQEIGGIRHRSSLMSDDTPVNIDPSSYPQGSTTAPSSPTTSSNSDGSDESGNCLFENMQKLYMESSANDSENDSLCWYCNVVVVLTNSYLNSASNALPSSVSLGKLILQLGFLIWLAYYILQQVSSLSPITPGRMLQEILVMGFKVALAYVAIDSSVQDLIAQYFINPIVGFGLDYGNILFDGLAAT